MGFVSTPVASGKVVVFQDRDWAITDPRLGAFVVSVDGNRPSGVAPVRGETSVEVPPGRHTVRIRQWWYRSPQVEVNIGPGQVVRLRADIDRSVGVIRRMGRMLVRPFRSLTLEVV